MEKAVIVSGVRLAIGRFGGRLSQVGATDLGGHVIKEAIARSGLSYSRIDECIMGMVLPCGYGQNPAKQAVLKAGLPVNVEAMTINKVCGSALKAVMLASQAIQCGDAEVVVAGGMESMSCAPYYMEKARWGHRMGPGTIEDHMVHDGLWDVVNDFHMGMCNELICEKYKISREDQDHYAAQSYHRTLRALNNGVFVNEIVPIEVADKKSGAISFDRDECPSPTSYEILSKMVPVFKKNGVTTAGNASKIGDGAAAVVVMNKHLAEKEGLEILGEIGAQATACISLEDVHIAPIHAIPKVLKKEGVTLNDIDLFEINEAFSGSSVALNRLLGLDTSKVNVNGGAVAMGHPIGASGAKLLVALIYEMQRRKARRGLVSLCLGGGEAVAMVIKR